MRASAFAFVLMTLVCTGPVHARVILLAPEGDEPGVDVRGVVADTSSGERIPGANVMLKGTPRGSSTNNSGFYLIPSVPPGTYDLVVSAVGYARRTVRITVSGSTPITVNIRISSRVIEQREVVIQSGVITTLTERSASVHVVTPQELERIPAAAQQDLLRSLQMLPGITSTSDVSAKFYVRGGAGDQNLILLDGMKVYNPFHAFGLFSILDPDIIRNAEVYTSAFPAGYGGRLSSVVNVTTKDGNLSGLSGNANINFLSGKVELDGPLGEDNTWMVSARSSLFPQSIDRLIPNSAPMSFADVFFKGTLGTSTGRFGLRGFASGDDFRPVPVDQPDYSWRSSAYSAVFSSLVSDRLFFDGSVSYSRAAIERITKGGGPSTPAASLLEEATVRGEVTSFMENQDSFFEGFEFNFPTIVDSLYAQNAYPRNYTGGGSEFWAWVRYEGTFGPLGLNAGLHADLPLLFGGAPLPQSVQPRLTLSWSLAGNWVAKASYGLFTQNLISISNEDDLISLFDAWIFLPENLRPEEAVHYVLGLEGNIFPQLATSVQVYAKDYTSITLYNPSKLFPSDPDYLSGTGNAYGAEALLRFSSPVIDLYGSYALASVKVALPGFSYYPRYDRRHTIKALATLHVAEGLEASLRWEYGSGYPFSQSAGFYTRLALTNIDTDPLPEGGGPLIQTYGPKNASRLPAYHRLDGSITYRLSLGGMRGALGVSVMNLYNAKNILYYDRGTQKTVYMIPFFPTASLTVEF